MSSALTRNIIPTVASRISARYSPTCSVKFDSMEISTVKIVNASSAIFTNCVSGSTTSMPPGALACSGKTSIHAIAAAQPTQAIMPPMMKRTRVSSSRIAVRSIRQHRERRDDHDGFRRGEFEQFEIAHRAPPFRNQSNNGESKLGTITSSNSRG